MCHFVCYKFNNLLINSGGMRRCWCEESYQRSRSLQCDKCWKDCVYFVIIQHHQFKHNYWLCEVGKWGNGRQGWGGSGEERARDEIKFSGQNAWKEKLCVQDFALLRFEKEIKVWIIFQSDVRLNCTVKVTIKKSSALAMMYEFLQNYFFLYLTFP